MSNTMADLRRECAELLRETLHGKEIDMMRNTVRLPHMLGVTPIGAIHSRRAEEGTILDVEHEFWQDFEEEITTRGQVKRRVESAVRSLREDDVLRMTHPYGEDADIVYCEVDTMDERGKLSLTTECAGCSETIDAQLSLNYDEGVEEALNHYYLQVDIDCPYCEYSSVRESALTVA